jgi:hypothetical protein
MAVGVALLLSACEKEIKRVGSEGKVALRIAVSHADFVEEGTPRGLNMKAKDEVLERVIIPVGEEEDYYLSVALKPDTEASEGLRSVPSDGQLITLAAFNASTDAQVGNAVPYYYSTSANDLIPVTAGAPLLVDVDETYYIVAYSYNSTTVSPGTSGIDPSNDLLWGKSADKYITESDRTVEINMAHLFSRVKVNISVEKISGASIQSIGTVTIEGGKQAGLNIRTGELTPGAGVAAVDLSSSITGGPQFKSTDYSVFYPSPTKVNISSITIRVSPTNYTRGPISADFTKTLLAGESYVLAVDLLRVGVAYTNVYWDGSKLTFDKYPSSPLHDDYQGVYFKFGSLIGFETDGWGIGHIFIPNLADGTWDGTKYVNSAHDLWSGTKNYDNIPYINTYGETLYPGDYASYEGDICSYLTGGSWSMLEGTSYGYYATSLTTLTGGSTGIPGISFREGFQDVFLPASGWWGPGNSSLQEFGLYGIYWTSLTLGSSQTWCLAFFYDTIDEEFTVEPWNFGNSTGISVRCVKKP